MPMSPGRARPPRRWRTWWRRPTSRRRWIRWGSWASGRGACGRRVSRRVRAEQALLPQHFEDDARDEPVSLSRQVQVAVEGIARERLPRESGGVEARQQVHHLHTAQLGRGQEALRPARRGGEVGRAGVEEGQEPPPGGGG